MKKAKIIEAYGSYDSEYGMSPLVAKGITDWAEVTDEEYEILKYYVKHYHNNNYSQLILVCDSDEHSVQKILADYIEEGRIKKATFDKQQKKAEERQKKADLARKNKIENQEKAMLAKLKEKYDK